MPAPAPTAERCNLTSWPYSVKPSAPGVGITQTIRKARLACSDVSAGGAPKRGANLRLVWGSARLWACSQTGFSELYRYRSHTLSRLNAVWNGIPGATMTCSTLEYSINCMIKSCETSVFATVGVKASFLRNLCLRSNETGLWVSLCGNPRL